MAICENERYILRTDRNSRNAYDKRGRSVSAYANACRQDRGTAAASGEHIHEQRTRSGGAIGIANRGPRRYDATNMRNIIESLFICDATRNDIQIRFATRRESAAGRERGGESQSRGEAPDRPFARNSFPPPSPRIVMGVVMGS